MSAPKSYEGTLFSYATDGPRYVLDQGKQGALLEDSDMLREFDGRRVRITIEELP